MRSGVLRLVLLARDRARGIRACAGGAAHGARVPRPADHSDRDPVPGDDVRRPLRHGLRRAPRTSSTPLGRSELNRRASTRCGSASRQARRPSRSSPSRPCAMQPASRSRRSSLDPEGLALTKDDTLVLTSEGFADPADRPVGARVRPRRPPARVAAGAERVPADRRRDARRAPEPRLRERCHGAERPLPLHRHRGRARPGRAAGDARGRQPCAAAPLQPADAARSTGSTSTGPTRSPSLPSRRRSSRSAASSSCCR